VTSKEDLTRIVATIAEHPLSGGFVNLVIANAGAMGPEPPAALDPGQPAKARPSLQEAYELLWAPEVADFDAVFTTNIAGSYFTAVAFLPLLDAGNAAANVAQASHVIIMGSASAYSRAASSKFAYGASKAGTNDLVRRLSTTLAPYRIRVNSIVPGSK
jgi:NAD(P)-dependent dehydrogenase (short-subunit alcohol dehydrogenase family)